MRALVRVGQCLRPMNSFDYGSNLRATGLGLFDLGKPWPASAGGLPAAQPRWRVQYKPEHRRNLDQHTCRSAIRLDIPRDPRVAMAVSGRDFRRLPARSALYCAPRRKPINAAEPRRTARQRSRQSAYSIHSPIACSTALPGSPMGITGVRPEGPSGQAAFHRRTVAKRSGEQVREGRIDFSIISKSRRLNACRHGHLVEAASKPVRWARSHQASIRSAVAQPQPSPERLCYGLARRASAFGSPAATLLKSSSYCV